MNDTEDLFNILLDQSGQMIYSIENPDEMDVLSILVDDERLAILERGLDGRKHFPLEIVIRRVSSGDTNNSLHARNLNEGGSTMKSFFKSIFALLLMSFIIFISYFVGTGLQASYTASHCAAPSFSFTYAGHRYICGRPEALKRAGIVK